MTGQGLLRRKLLAGAATAALALGVSVTLPAQQAEAFTRKVKNISTGYRIAVKDNNGKHTLQPGDTVNLSTGGRKVWVNATDCITIKDWGTTAYTWCAGSTGRWESIGWSAGTGTLKRTN